MTDLIPGDTRAAYIVGSVAHGWDNTVAARFVTAYDREDDTRRRSEVNHAGER
ncbi:hypothetical protein [Streptomyces sp. NBC_00347]|uniref:hypothetical protein n=1 Tax=Streptomyces sp. NBC_00347 TaxID=2975721 RepID=UPI00225640FF|nr:hypothetical protein [Streptomyces sp. NBC_00347]MCX5126769.1 hypothetical protein [Streptomyces sp. NBC_00347]